MKHLIILLTSLLSMSYAPAAAQQPDDAIPFDYNRYLYVQGTIFDSIHGTFIFDTGAGITILDTTFLAHSGLLAGKTQPVNLMGVGSRPIKSSYSGDSIKISLGNYSKHITATVLVKLTDLMNGFEGIDGVLGIALFNDTTFAIDYTKQTLSLVSSKELDSLTGYQRIPFTRDPSGLIEVDVTAVVDPAKQIQGVVTLDTGNPKTVDFTPNKKQLKKLRQNINKSTSYDVAMMGVGGGGIYTLFETQEFRIGQLSMPARYAGVVESSSVIKSKTIGGMLGNSMLSKFHVIVDMKGGTIYLKPNNNSSMALHPNYTGVYIASFPNKLFVNGTSHHPTALQLDDVITAINGVTIDKMASDEVEEIFCTPDLQYTLTILRSGAIQQVTITNLNSTTLWQ